MAEYLMGIDAGTGSVRVALFDFRGQNRAYACLLYTSTKLFIIKAMFCF